MVEPGRSWLGRFFTFVPGAIVGAVLGFRAVVAVNEPITFYGVWIGTAVVGGLLSASFGVRFWAGLARLRWFFP